MNLAYKKILGKFTKVLGFGKTPPPCWENFPNNIVFFYESVPKHTYMIVCILCSCRSTIITDVQVNKSKTWMIRKAHKRISVGTLETRCLLWQSAHKITNLWKINQEDIYMIVRVLYSNHNQELTRISFWQLWPTMSLKWRGKATLGFLVLLFRHHAFTKKIQLKNIMKGMMNSK